MPTAEPTLQPESTFMPDPTGTPDPDAARSDAAVVQRHSRSIAAGYDPRRLARSSVLVVGAGALGQNVVQGLALSGVGELLIVDHDRFEDHNATRSPLYPQPEDLRRWGDGKAANVAQRARRIATALQPVVRYVDAPVQALGDGIIAHVDVVVSAVDNARARAYLAERCKVLGTPMLEGGFSGPSFVVGRFDGVPASCCYRCINPHTEGVHSCTRYANAALRASVAPATQNGAATTAGILCEQLIMALQGVDPVPGRNRIYGDIRAMTLRSTTSPRDPSCPGRHHLLAPIDTDLGLTASSTAHALLRAADAALRAGSAEASSYSVRGDLTVVLPDEVVITMPCAAPGCGNVAHVLAAAWTWLADPRCDACGGPWCVADPVAGPHTETTITRESPAELLDVRLARLGYGPGAGVEVFDGDDRGWLLRLGGDPVRPFIVAADAPEHSVPSVSAFATPA